MAYVDEEYRGRVYVDAQDAVVVKYLLRRDAGPWRCTIFEAGSAGVFALDDLGGRYERGAENKTAELFVTIDYTFFHDGITSMMVRA